MRDQSVRTGVQQVVRPLEPLGDVIRGQDRHLRGVREPLGAHQLDVDPGNRQNARAPPRAGRHRARRLGVAEIDHRMIREERCQVRGDTDRAHPGTATAVRNTERLVQVEVTDVRTDVTRPAEADLGVHVGAIHVDLATVRVHDRADLLDRRLEHAVRRRIRHHQCREIRRVLPSFGAQVGDVNIPLVVRTHHHNAHARHHGARRVGAVRADRNQADVAMHVAAGPMPGADREQAGILALRTGVRLQRHGGEPGDRAEVRLQSLEHLEVPGGLLARCERMNRAELGPAHRHHLGGGVELHGARAERDHRGSERQVFRFEAAHVAQHLGLGVMAMEDRVREIRAGAMQVTKELFRLCQPEELVGMNSCKRGYDLCDVANPGGFVECHGNPRRRQAAQVDAEFERLGHHRVAILRRHCHRDGVEEAIVIDGDAGLAKRVGEVLRERMHLERNLLDPLGAMIDRVHRRHHRQ